MKRSSLLIVGVVAVAIGAGYGIGVRRGGFPSLNLNSKTIGFEPREISLGEQLWMQEVPFESRFVNRSATSIVILRFDSSCGCTLLDNSSFQNQSLEPGQSITVTGKIDTKQTLGSKTVDLRAHLTDGRVITGQLYWKTIGTYEVEPRSINLGRVVADEEKAMPSTTLKFHSKGARLRQATTDSDWLAVEMGDEANLLVKLVRERLPVGRTFGRIILETDDPHVPQFSIPVLMDGARDPLAVPSNVFLRGTQSQRVKIIDANGGLQRPMEWSTNDPALTVRKSAEDTLEVQIKPDDALRGGSAVVSVVDARNKKTSFTVTQLR